MAKDPAFLFYSKDFYEGTRMMLPEERACYIDLLIYQHQNGGFIPNEIKRLTMYCSGIDEATLEATLKTKFELSDKGWFNRKLASVVSNREEFASKQSVNGTVGQFWKKAKALLTVDEHDALRDGFKGLSNDQIFSQIKSIDLKNQTSLIGMLQAMLKHLAIGNVNVNGIKNLEDGKGVPGEKPTTEHSDSNPQEVNQLTTSLSEPEFIDIWSRARFHYDNAQTTFKKLGSFERQCFTQLTKDYSFKEFEQAVAGLFFQGTLPAVRVRPEHFLKRENFEKYLDCWINNQKIFANDPKKEASNRSNQQYAVSDSLKKEIADRLGSEHKIPYRNV